MKIERIFDISVPLSDCTPVWPGDNHFHFEPRVQIKDGAICNSSSVFCTVHCMTHADAPKHYIDDGKDMASVDLSRFMGNSKVREVITEGDLIEEVDLAKLDIEEGDAILLKTKNKGLLTDGVFHKQYVSIGRSGAEYLVKKKIRCIGVDYVGVEWFYSKDGIIHHMLLEHEIGILEGLLLDDVPVGDYFLCALPLRIVGSDGSPVRAVLMKFADEVNRE